MGPAMVVAGRVLTAGASADRLLMVSVLMGPVGVVPVLLVPVVVVVPRADGDCAGGHCADGLDGDVCGRRRCNSGCGRGSGCGCSDVGPGNDGRGVESPGVNDLMRAGG